MAVTPGHQIQIPCPMCVCGCGGEKYTFSPAELPSDRVEREILDDSTQFYETHFKPTAPGANGVARELLRNACPLE